MCFSCQTRKIIVQFRWFISFYWTFSSCFCFLTSYFNVDLFTCSWLLFVFILIGVLVFVQAHELHAMQQMGSTLCAWNVQFLILNQNDNFLHNIVFPHFPNRLCISIYKILIIFCEIKEKKRKNNEKGNTTMKEKGRIREWKQKRRENIQTN